MAQWNSAINPLSSWPVEWHTRTSNEMNQVAFELARREICISGRHTRDLHGVLIAVVQAVEIQRELEEDASVYEL